MILRKLTENFVKVLPLLLIGLFLVVLLVGLFDIRIWIGRSFPGFLIYSNQIVGEETLSGWTGVQNGIKSFDKIIKVNGIKVSSSNDIYNFALERPLHTPIKYSVIRGDREFDLIIPTMEFTLHDFLLVFGVLYFIGIVFFLSGILVIYLRPNIIQSKIFFYFCYFLSLWFISSFDSHTSYLIDIESMVWVFVPFLFIYLAFVFPSESKVFININKYIILIAFFISLLFFILQLAYFNSQNIWEKIILLVWFNFLFSILFFLTLLIITFFKSKSIVDKQRSLIVLLGQFIGFVVPICIVVIAVLLNISNITYLALPVIFFPISIAYAIVKHKLFDIDVIIRKTLVYTSLSGVLGFIIVLLILGFNYVFAAHGGWKHPSFFVVLSVFLVVALNPLRNRFQNIIDKAFFRTRYDYERTIFNLAEAMTSILDIDEIVNKIISTIADTMQVTSVTIYLFNRDAGLYRVHNSTISKYKINDFDLSPENNLINYLINNRTEIFYEDLQEDKKYFHIKDKLFNTFKMLNTSLIVPLFIKNDLVGILMLGDKKSGLSFSSRDIKLLRILANQSAIAIENAYAFKLVENYARKLEVTNKELTQTHLQLMQAEKMSAVGQLAAGIAHEIRNPLNIIEGARYYLSTEVDHGVNNDIVSEYLDYIKNQVKRTDRLITSLINFSKPEPPSFKSIQINGILENAIVLMKKQIEDHKIKLIIDLNSEIPEIMGDQNQLWQLFINIIINSVQAMPNGGELKITAERAKFNPNRILIKFADTGQGIEENHISKIFDPFFTTKKNGHGLGLAICYKIVEGHKGNLKVESQIGKGSIFIIEFPIMNIAKTGVQNGEEKNISN